MNPEPTLELTVNGEPRRVPEGWSVGRLVEELLAGRADEARAAAAQAPAPRVAVAVNRVVVPRSRLAAHRLRAGDRIEILEAVGGG